MLEKREVDIPKPTKVIFQEMARPTTVPMIRVAIAWMMTLAVIPARPLTFCAFELSREVRTPV